MDTKTCCQCGEDLPRSEFNKRKRSKDGLQPQCRNCQRKYYRENRDHIRKLIRDVKEKLKEEQAQLIVSYLHEHPCVDCGETDIVVLEFDHCRGEKRMNVTTMIGAYATSTVMKEIEKCDVVCSNCHTRRTAKRAGWPRFLAAVAQG